MARDDDIDPVDLFGAMALYIPVGLFGAWVILKLYEWHVMPIWEDAPRLGYGRVIGLLLVVGLVRGIPETSRQSRENDRVRTMVARALVMAFALFIGWWAA